MGIRLTHSKKQAKWRRKIKNWLIADGRPEKSKPMLYEFCFKGI